MSAFLGVVSAAALVLVVSGGAKLADPGPTARALTAARLPAGMALVRLLALGEVALGATALTVGGPVVPLLVAAAYLGFVGFVWRTRAVGGGGGCGCFGGESDVRPGAVHVVVDLVLAGGSAAAAGGRTSLYDRVVDAPASGLALAVTAAVAAGLAVVVLTRLAEVADLVAGR